MEKLKSWNALSNFPTTPAAIAGIYVLKIERALAWFEDITQGLKPRFAWCSLRHPSTTLRAGFEVVPFQGTGGDPWEIR
jgi:hypothetical protein